MGFTIETGISAITVFIQGLLSFFSPCVLPLVPLYLGYLAGGLNAGVTGADSGSQEGSEKTKRHGERLRLFFRVFCFTLGISGAFFVLGLGAGAAGNFFSENRLLLARIGGVIIILFGLYQLGVFGSSRVLGSEHRIPLHLDKMTMSPVTALIMGFTFSFAWTPCVGPALTSVLLMAGSAESSAKGFLLIGVYTLGFILPFLACGIFTASLLAWFKKHMKAVRYTVKIGGVLMILMGVLMFILPDICPCPGIRRQKRRKLHRMIQPERTARDSPVQRRTLTVTSLLEMRLLKMLGMKLPGKNLPEMTMRQKRRIRLPERMSLSSRTSLGRHTLLTSIKER